MLVNVIESCQMVQANAIKALYAKERKSNLVVSEALRKFILNVKLGQLLMWVCMWQHQPLPPIAITFNT